MGGGEENGRSEIRHRTRTGEKGGKGNQEGREEGPGNQEGRREREGKEREIKIEKKREK